MLVSPGARLAALESLYESYCHEAVRLAYRLLGDREAAEDVVQDAFLSVWRSGASYDALRGSERTWVLAVVRHRVTDHWRAAHRRPLPSLQDDAEGLPRNDDPAADVVQRLDRQDVLVALETLPAAQRLVLELAYFGELSHTEVATQLGLPVGTVKGRIRLALDRLRLAMQHLSSAD
ncbi:MAG: RNA polymerase sigma factor [Chloroflexota bacterium]